jgi:hypothetical protein
MKHETGFNFEMIIAGKHCNCNITHHANTALEALIFTQGV